MVEEESPALLAPISQYRAMTLEQLQAELAQMRNTLRAGEYALASVRLLKEIEKRGRRPRYAIT